MTLWPASARLSLTPSDGRGHRVGLQQIDEDPAACNDKADVDCPQCHRNQRLQCPFP